MLSPAEFINLYAQVGAKKSSNSAQRLYLSAVLAGFLIGAGAVVANTAGHMLTNAGLSRVLCGLLFPFGLIMVIITGAELFTGNCLIAISLLEKRASLAGMVRNLVIVYIGNLLGALVLAAAIVYCGLPWRSTPFGPPPPSAPSPSARRWLWASCATCWCAPE